MSAAPRTCDQLGVCQHAAEPCEGHCQRVRLPVSFVGPEPEPEFDPITRTELVVLVLACAISVAVACGLAGYAWAGWLS